MNVENLVADESTYNPLIWRLLKLFSLAWLKETDIPAHIEILVSSSSHIHKNESYEWILWILNDR